MYDQKTFIYEPKYGKPLHTLSQCAVYKLNRMAMWIAIIGGGGYLMVFGILKTIELILS